MLINSYYYAPHCHSLLTRHLEWDFARMAEMGADIVSVCVNEEHLYKHSYFGWVRPRLKNVVRLAHKHGLAIHAVPNRWAGLTAGWIDGYAHFSVLHTEDLTRAVDGKIADTGELACCVNRAPVRRHMQDNIRLLYEDFEFDGLIWDEPHGQVCHCEVCRSLAPGGQPTAAWYHQRFAELLDELGQLALSIRRDLIISLFIEPGRESLIEALTKSKTIEYLGSDGHIRDEDHQMHRMKGTIFQSYEKIDPVIRAAGKKTFYLLEAQRHRDEDLDHYLKVMERAFRLPMDQLMFYYSAHEFSFENEERFNQATWKMVASLKKNTSRSFLNGAGAPHLAAEPSISL